MRAKNIRYGQGDTSEFLEKLAAEAEQEPNTAQESDELDGINADDLFFIRVSWSKNGKINTLVCESDPLGHAIDISEVPELLRKQLLKYLEGRG